MNSLFKDFSNGNEVISSPFERIIAPLESCLKPVNGTVNLS